MKALNAALAALSAHNKAGFRALSAPAPSSAASTSRPGSAASARSATTAVRGQASSASLRAAAGQGAVREKVELAAKDAGRALRELRSLVREGTLARKKVEVEKAAGSVVASLVEMELYRHALVELTAMRDSLLSWWSPSSLPSPSSSSASPHSHASTFLVPLPPASFLAPPTLSETLNAPPRPSLLEIVPLVLAVQQYLLGCLFRLPDISAAERAEQLAVLLRRSEAEGGPVEWRKLLEDEARKGEMLEGVKEPEKEALVKRLDAMMTSMFGTITKGCTGADGTVAPEALLTLRTHALLYYSTLSSLSSRPSPFLPSSPSPSPPPEKLEAFHDQHRKVLLLYGRAAEALGQSEKKIGEEVRAAFELVVSGCEDRGVGGREGRKWRELCEVVLHIARRADDHPFVDRVSSHLGISSSATAFSATTSEPPVDPEVATSQLCAKILNALGAFEAWSKSASPPSSSAPPSPPSPVEEAVIAQLHSLTAALPSLTRLRASSPSGPALAPELRSKIDRTLERARYVFAKHLKRGGKRAEQLLVPAGAAVAPVQPVDKAVREALDRLAVHAARVLADPLREGEGGGAAEEKERRDLATTAVDSLLLLAYSAMVVDARDSHGVSFAFLERCLPLVGLSPSSSSAQEGNGVDLAQHYSLRTLASAFYNLGGTLFNAQMPDSAVRFCRRACEVATAALERGRGEGLLSCAAEGEDGLEEGMRRLTVGEENGDGKGEKERKEKVEALKDLDRLMARRWELLGLASHAVGDKKSAFDAYSASALSQPQAALATLSADAARLSLSDLTAAHPALSKLTHRLTRLGVFDLLLPASSIPLSSSPSFAALPAAARGALLELQLAALLPSADKPDARRAALAVIGALEETYDAGEYPVRRAKVLLAKMQVLAGAGGKEMLVQAAAQEIERLCSVELLGADTLLRPYIPQLRSLSHLYLALHAHASQAPSPLSNPAAAVEAGETVASEARQALNILRSALEGGGELPPSPSAPAPGARSSPVVTRTVAFQSPVKNSPPRPSAAPAPSRARRPTRAAATPARATRGAAVAAAPAARAPAAGAAALRRSTRAAPPAEQVTPPRRKRGVVQLDDEGEKDNDGGGAVSVKAAAVPKTPVKAAEKGEVKLDDVEKVYGLFETVARLLGTLGHQLLKIAFLRFLRRLSSKIPSPTSAASAFVSTSAQLAHKYVRLGKTGRAGVVLAQAEGRMPLPGAEVSETAQIEYWLLYAEYLAMLGNHERASTAYETALKLVDGLDEADVTTSSSVAKIVERTLLLQRAGLAASVCSVMLQRKGELSRSLAPAMQAIRLGTRALNNISRLAPAPPKSTSTDDSAFQAPKMDHVTALADAAPIGEKKSSATLAGGAHAGLSWQLAEALLDSTLRVATLHFLRGTPKSAEFYAQQALDLAEDLGSSRMMARALALRTDVRLHWGRIGQAAEDLDVLDALVAKTTSPEATEARRLQADLHTRANLHSDAYQLYLDAQKSLELFVSTAADREAGSSPVKHQTPAKHLSPAQTRSGYFTHPSPSPSSSALRLASPLDLVLPAVHAYLLRMQVHLLQSQKRQKGDEIHRLLRRLAKLASLEEDKADELKLLAAIQIQDLLARCSSDPVLGMLSDSVLSMPVLGIAAAGAVVKVGTPRTGPTVLNSLKDIEGLLSRAIGFSTSRSHPAKLRELSLLSATMRTLQASVGKQARRSTGTVAHTLDLAVGVTLRREMLDAIDHKLAISARHDDLHWPTLSPSPTITTDEGDKASLHSLRERYRLESAEPILTDSSLSAILPESWSAISIHLTPEHDSLILVRHRHASDPVLFKLPLDRLARREGDEEDALTYAVAAAELKDIIDRSNEGTQNAKHVDGKEQRAAWWAARKELDQRLEALLQNMEDAWLGAFKSIFYDSRQTASEDFLAFKTRFERILRRSMSRAATDKKAARFKLDDAIVECLAALPSTSREEDLEDLFYYAAESFHFSGVPLAHDETDVDQVVVDLREALEELHGTKSAPKRSTDPNEHTFLVLDKALVAFPWESLPCLRGRSVSRLPSIAFLRDRLDLASSRSSNSDSSSHDFVVDPGRASFVLNPGGDLKNTQKTFEPWLEERKAEAGWGGVVARAPLEEEMKASLSQKELFLYFGHGGAEQYIRSQTIRHLPRCAVTMLWGCSSGLLKDQGDFDPVGTPYHYMVAGCPALVANLWDVTDKDIDKFAFSVFRRTGLAPPDSDAPSPPSSKPNDTTLTAAIAQSRDVCNLRYLNGAAPVVYGIPVRFSSTPSSSSSSATSS
ncbi:hypothetical protein JCM8097_007957 [Rhodosporidiobolus ruineniae]